MVHPITEVLDAIPPPLKSPAVHGPWDTVMGSTITAEIASIFQGRALDCSMFFS